MLKKPSVPHGNAPIRISFHLWQIHLTTNFTNLTNLPDISWMFVCGFRQLVVPLHRRFVVVDNSDYYGRWI